MKITFITKRNTFLDGGPKCTIEKRSETLTIRDKESKFVFSKWSTTNAGRTYNILPGTHVFEGDSKDFERFVRRNWSPFERAIKIIWMKLENCQICCEWEDLPPTQEEIDTVYDSWPEDSENSDVDHVVV